jgi:oligopeptidase B
MSRAPEARHARPERAREGALVHAIGDQSVSPDGKLLAYTTDDNGYRQYRLHVKNLETGDTLTVTDERVTSLAWAADGRTLFYTQEDPVSKRSYRLISRELSQPNLVSDRRGAGRALRRERGTLAQRRVADLHDLQPHHVRGARAARRPAHGDMDDDRAARAGPRVLRGPPPRRVLDPRQRQGRNFRLVTAPVATPDPSHWTEVLPHRDGRHDRERRVLRAPRRGERARARAAADHRARAGEASARAGCRSTEVAYTVAPAANEEYDPKAFRYGYQSFLTRPSVYDLDLATLSRSS